MIGAGAWTTVHAPAPVGVQTPAPLWRSALARSIGRRAATSSPIHGRPCLDHDLAVLEVGELRPRGTSVRSPALGDRSGDADLTRKQLLCIDDRAFVALGACPGEAAQDAENDHVASGDDATSVIHIAEYDEVPVVQNFLPGAERSAHDLWLRPALLGRGLRPRPDSVQFKSFKLRYRRRDGQGGPTIQRPVELHRNVGAAEKLDSRSQCSRDLALQRFNGRYRVDNEANATPPTLQLDQREHLRASSSVTPRSNPATGVASTTSKKESMQHMRSTGLISAIALPLSLASTWLFATGHWPAWAALLVGILYLSSVQRLPFLRIRPTLYTTSLLYAVIALVLAPFGSLIGISRSDYFWLLISFLVEIGVALIIWVVVRPRFVRKGTVHLGRAFGVPRSADISLEDRFLHVHVLGPTGSGKTMGVLWPMAHQDLLFGHGLLVLDPKGDLADEIVKTARRLGRTVHSVSPKTAPEVGIDPFAGPRERAAESVAYALSGAFSQNHEFYRSVGQGMLRNAALALKEALDEPTLLDLERFLQDEDRRREILLSVSDQHVREYFRDQVGGWSARFRQDAFIGVQAALAELLANPWARSLFTMRPAIDFDHLLSSGEVLVLSLPEGELGLSARGVGAFALMSFQAAALRRVDGPPAFVYADEFQTFAQADFSSFLAEARSHRVGAVLAHQNLGQLGDDLRQAVLANARNRILLGGLPQGDLEDLRESLGRRFVATPGGMREVPRHDFETVRRMPRGQAIVEVCVGGSPIVPMRIRLRRP